MAPRRKYYVVLLLTVVAGCSAPAMVPRAIAAEQVLLAASACTTPLATVKQTMIDRDIAAYAGPCPCPYNRDRAGRSCGARSAYSRPGGASPSCYATDISDVEAIAYCQRNLK